MAKDQIVVKIPKKLDQDFRNEVNKQGKLYSLALEEALKMWLKKNKK